MAAAVVGLVAVYIGIFHSADADISVVVILKIGSVIVFSSWRRTI